MKTLYRLYFGVDFRLELSSDVELRIVGFRVCIQLPGNPNGQYFSSLASLDDVLMASHYASLLSDISLI